MVTGRDRQDFPNLPDDLAELPDRALLLEFNEVILKCCHMDPRERYATAANLLADVRRLQAGRSLRQGRFAEAIGAFFAPPTGWGVEPEHLDTARVERYTTHTPVGVQRYAMGQYGIGRAHV